MANNYCTRCGKRVSPIDNYCANCGSSTDYPLLGNLLKNDLLTKKEECPRCEGTGECSQADNMNPAGYGILGCLTFGISALAMKTTYETCKLCGGTGEI